MAGGWLLIVIMLAPGSGGGNAIAMSRMGTHASCEAAGKAVVKAAEGKLWSYATITYTCTEG